MPRTYHQKPAVEMQQEHINIQSPCISEIT
jgi:hypothetical protein